MNDTSYCRVCSCGHKRLNHYYLRRRRTGPCSQCSCKKFVKGKPLNSRVADTHSLALN